MPPTSSKPPPWPCAWRVGPRGRPGRPRSSLVSEPLPFGPGPAEAPPEGPCPRTAARLEAGRIVHGEAHRDRLAAGGATPWLEGAFQAAAEHFGQAPDGVVRLRYDAAGGRLWGAWEPLPATPFPYRLLPLAHPLPPSDRPRLKGADGPWQGPVLAAARAAGAQDAMLLWPDGTVAESAIAALALEREGELWVPPAGGRVASLAEALDLPGWARKRGLLIRVGAFAPEALGSGRLWCLNAVRGLWQAESLPPLSPMKP
ncbi:MAG TPA: aminotransferase class IV [Holophagaceae bacterium]|nr:aminotransferase class IV [Holophagaceae bacterium]